MKNFFKLTGGEFKKLIKSKALAIMSLIMALLVGGMTIIYYFYDDELNSLLDMVFSNSIQFDIYNVLEGEIDSKIEVMAGLYDIPMDSIKSIGEQLQDKPEIKNGIIHIDPAVMKALRDLSNSPNPYIPEELKQQFREQEMFITLQALTIDDYYNSNLSEAKAILRRLTEQTEFIKNNGEYGRSINGFIKAKLAALETFYVELRHSLDEVNRTLDLTNYKKLLSDFRNFAVVAGDLSYYTYGTALETNYLLFPSTDYSSTDFRKLRDALNPVTNNAFTEIVKNFNKIIKDKEADNTVAKFQADLFNLSSPSEIDFSLDLKDSDNADTPLTEFLKGLNDLMDKNIIADGKIFFYYNNIIKKGAEAYVNGEGLPTDVAVAQAISNYAEMFEDGLAMTPFNNYLDAAYEAVYTKEDYETMFKPYFDDKEAIELSNLINEINGYSTMYKQIDWVMAMMPNNTGAISDSAAIFAAGKEAFRSLVSRAATLNKMFSNTAKKHVIDANGLNDEETKRIFGMQLFTNKYSLNSNITQTQFLIDNNYSAESYVVPENLQGGYGTIQFIFELMKIVLIFFAVFIAAGMIAGEHSDGTMKLLLIRPQTRSKVFGSKFFTVAAVLFFFTVLNFGLSVLAGLYWGFSSPMALSIVNSSFAVVMHPLAIVAIMHGCAYIEALIFGLIAFAIGTICKNRTVAVVVAIFIFLLSYVLGMLLSQFIWYKYIIFNNSNLLQYFLSTGPNLADMNLLFSVIVNVVYCVVMWVVTKIIFVRRDAT